MLEYIYFYLRDQITSIHKDFFISIFGRVFFCLALYGVLGAAETLVIHFKADRINPQQAEEIGRKIWMNECGGKVDGLTSWNKGESFASLGIGHFIWFPDTTPRPFNETFPSLMRFMKNEGVEIPAWLVNTVCPWKTREEFQADLASTKMGELRAFLLTTIAVQTKFMIARLEEAMIIPLQANEAILKEFNRVANTSNGLFALIDYLNFKGAGTLPEERYHGQGWGLLQVLQKMAQRPNTDPIKDFIAAAEIILDNRIKNSPPERGEERWRLGWYNRIQKY